MDAWIEELKAWQKEMMNVQERMEAKLDACQEKMDANNEKVYANLEEMKTGQAKMKSTVSANLEKMDICLEKTEAMDLEANPRELQSTVVHQEIHKCRLQWKLSKQWRTNMGSGTRSMVGPRRSWLPPTDR
jgi:hypothetical protein